MIDIKYIINSLINRIENILDEYKMVIECDETQLKLLCNDFSDNINKYSIEYTNITTLPFIISRKNNNQVTAYFLPLTKQTKIFIYSIYDTLFPYNEGTITNEYSKINNQIDKENEKIDYNNYGLPKDKLFPLNNKEDVMEAIRHFKYCTEGKMKELAININNAIEDFNMTVPLSYSNPFYPLINQAALVNTDNDNLNVTLESMNNSNYIWGYENELELMKQTMQTELEIPHYYNKYISHMIDYRKYFESGSLSDVLIVVQNLCNLTYSKISKFHKLRNCKSDITNEDIFKINSANRFSELFIKRNIEGKDLLFGLSADGSLYWILMGENDLIIFIPMVRNSKTHNNFYALTNDDYKNMKLEIVNFKKKSKEPRYKNMIDNSVKVDTENLLENLNDYIDYKNKDNAIALFVLHESQYINDIEKISIKNKFKKSIREITREEAGFNFYNYFINSPLLEHLDIGDLKNPAISRIKLTKIMR